MQNGMVILNEPELFSSSTINESDIVDTKTKILPNYYEILGESIDIETVKNIAQSKMISKKNNGITRDKI